MRWTHACWQCTAPCYSLLCDDCWQALPWYTSLGHDDVVTACFHYQYPIDRFITQFKFQYTLAMGRLLSDSFIQAKNNLGVMANKPDYLLPVPLHKQRLRERGFNQALELAKPLHRAFDIPIDTRLLTRTRHTEPQFTLSAPARKKQLRRAFMHTRRLSGEHIAIIDDVYTTGATTQAIRQQLLAAGAGRVSIWVIAKTPLGR